MMVMELDETFLNNKVGFRSVISQNVITYDLKCLTYVGLQVHSQEYR